MKSIKIFILFILIGSCASAQSLFEGIPKPQKSSMLTGKKLSASAITEAVETEKNLLRPVTNIASYIIGKDVKESSIITGAGVGYEHLKYNAATEKWNIVWSVNALLYGRIALGNESNGKKMLTGVSIGAFDNLIMVGYATDFSNSYGTIGVGIPLNNL